VIVTQPFTSLEYSRRRIHCGFVEAGCAKQQFPVASIIVLLQCETIAVANVCNVLEVTRR
jgi:hypothetical protein